MHPYIAYAVVLVRKALDFFQQGGTNNAPHRLKLQSTSIMHAHPVVTPPPPAICDIFQQTRAFFSSHASQIMDNIWIGNALNAADILFLRGVPIRAVVNVSAEVPNMLDQEILYCQCRARDTTGCTLPFAWVSKFMRAQVVRGRAVLVHCFIGRSRSVAAVCHYLMEYCGHSFDSAYAYVSLKRPMACINADLARQLRAAEAAKGRPRRLLSLPAPPPDPR